ncbi:hypothetical protein [Leptospira mtsangambouensis]|uniref:hypothetical protein n=1 Tax=Leptospira mtsangambouensis TaxID=2484912 RepID=UPI001EEBA505|nr:hypothetical protein [Leptospira mtsangambouensis]MCG6142795.1 hypothetical protein [Leptospira mtsangambouensis]
MVFTLKLETNPKENKVIIDKESINQFDQRIKKLQDSFLNYESLLSIFESEREHYVLLISLLIGIMTIFTIYFGFTRLVEKQEYEDIKNDLEKLKESLYNELIELDKKSFTFELKNINDQYSSDINFVDNNHQIITELNKFVLHLELKFSKLSNKINEYDEKFIEDQIYYIRNILINASKYAKKRGLIENPLLDTNLNPVFYTITKELYKNVKPEIYNSIVNKLLHIHPTAIFEDFKSK